MEEQNCQQTEQKCCCGHKLPCKKIMGFLLCVFLIVLIVYFVQLVQNTAKERTYIGQEIVSTKTIVVSDSAEIYAKPDLAMINFSVFSEGKTVAKTLDENTKKMNAVIETIKKNGVAEKDLKTTNFTIYPRYEYPYPSGKRIFTGYEVRQTVDVKIRNLEKVSQAIEDATSAGANEVGNLSFTIDKQDEFKKQVRGEAINKAKKKAEELASQLGVKLVRISNFSEGETGVYPQPYFTDKAMMGIGGGESAPQIQTGENKIEVSVSITYEIN